MNFLILERCPKPYFLFGIAPKRKQKTLVEENANALFSIVYNSTEVSVLQTQGKAPSVNYITIGNSRPQWPSTPRLPPSLIYNSNFH